MGNGTAPVPPTEGNMSNDYSEQDKAALAKKRGAYAASISDPEARRKYIAAQGNAEASGNSAALAKVANDTHNDETTQALDSFKNGGRVKKTGPYLLHKNEVVVPAKHASTMKKILSGKAPSKAPRKKKTTSLNKPKGTTPPTRQLGTLRNGGAVNA